MKYHVIYITRYAKAIDIDMAAPMSDMPQLDTDYDIDEDLINQAIKFHQTKQDKRTLSPYERYKDLDIEKLHKFKLTSGKWKDASFYFVFTKGHDYVEWCLANMDRISAKSTLYLFVHYARRLMKLK